MELLPTGAPVPGERRRVFRHSVVAEAVAAVLFVGGPVAAAWWLRDELPSLASWQGWMAAPFVLLGGGIWLLVVSAVLHSLAMSLRGSNWVLQVTREGLFLNLRSYRNAHLGGTHPTVARLSPREVERAGRVTETSTYGVGDARRTEWRRFLELHVPGVDLEPLRDALAAEAACEAPPRGCLGVRSRTRFQHAPVLVPEPGVVWVEWRPGMLDALDPRVKRVPPRRVERDDEGDGGEPLEARVDALLERGATFRALRLVKAELGLDTTAARAWLDGRARRSA